MPALAGVAVLWRQEETLQAPAVLTRVQLFWALSKPMGTAGKLAVKLEVGWPRSYICSNPREPVRPPPLELEPEAPLEEVEPELELEAPLEELEVELSVPPLELEPELLPRGAAASASGSSSSLPAQAPTRRASARARADVAGFEVVIGGLRSRGAWGHAGRIITESAAAPAHCARARARARGAEPGRRPPPA